MDGTEVGNCVNSGICPKAEVQGGCMEGQRGTLSLHARCRVPVLSQRMMLSGRDLRRSDGRGGFGGDRGATSTKTKSRPPFKFCCELRVCKAVSKSGTKGVYGPAIVLQRVPSPVLKEGECGTNDFQAAQSGGAMHVHAVQLELTDALFEAASGL
eukprot:3934138-Rhodomonas_salina.2